MIAYIGLGSNLNGPVRQLTDALTLIGKEQHIQVLKVSSCYQSQALTLPDSQPQPDYANAVVKISTDLSPEALLTRLNDIENRQGRTRSAKWASRTLDLDILLCEDQRVETKDLSIPHAQLAYRNFVIHPLYEIAGNIMIPGLGELAKLVEQTDWVGLRKIAWN